MLIYLVHIFSKEIQVGFVQSSISVAENVGRVDICVTVLKSPSHLVPNINLEVSTLDYGDASKYEG